MKRIGKIIWAGVLACLFLVGCAGDKEANKPIIDAVYENLEMIQNENLEGYMATIHEESPAYAPTEEVMKQLIYTTTLNTNSKRSR